MKTPESTMNKLLCIYHKSCADGFGSALAVKTWADSNNRECEFISAYHGDILPIVDDRDIYIVDFSYPRDVLLEMKEKAASVVVIDHHKTAQADLQGLDFCIFNMDKSAAVLTWETLLPERSVPLLLKYIQDRDIWQWKLPDSKAVSAGISLLEYDFNTWERFLVDSNINELINDGRTILRYQELCVKKAIESDILPMENIAGYTVPCINTTHLISETGNELAKDQPFCAMYFETKNDRIYSLRSDKNGIDVSEIAKQFGGGGHFHAAGFQVSKPVINLKR